MLTQESAQFGLVFPKKSKEGSNVPKYISKAQPCDNETTPKHVLSPAAIHPRAQLAL